MSLGFPVCRTLSLEPCRPLRHYAECSFECQPHLPNQTVVEQPAEDRDSVRYATRRSELRQRYGRVRSPVASGFRNLHEPGTQGKRWMTSEIRDGELFVAQRRHDQHIDVAEDARHF